MLLSSLNNYQIESRVSRPLGSVISAVVKVHSTVALLLVCMNELLSQDKHALKRKNATAYFPYRFVLGTVPENQQLHLKLYLFIGIAQIAWFI